jgi:hypothetical protein
MENNESTITDHLREIRAEFDRTAAPVVTETDKSLLHLLTADASTNGSAPRDRDE